MRKLIVAAGIITVFLVLVFIPGKKWARGHVNYITAVDDHPLYCLNCHLYNSKSPLISKLVNREYLSPMNIAVSEDGKKLFVTAQDADKLYVVDAAEEKILSKIDVGHKPHSVILEKTGRFAYITNQWSDNVSVVDIADMKVVDTLSTGNGPAGLSFSSDGKVLYVVNSYSSDLTVIDLADGIEKKRLSTGSNPTGIQLSPNGKDLYITSRRAVIVPYGEPMATELTLVDDESRRLKSFLPVESAYLMENIAFTPSGDLAFVTLIRPKHLIPTLQVERGWMMNHGFGVIEQKGDGRIIQLLIDEPQAYYPDPFDIVLTPDGKKAFISSSGVNMITVIDIDSVRNLITESTPEMLSLWANHLGISSRYVIKRIPTGANPKGLALSPDGKYLYVAEHLNDKIGVISTETLTRTGEINLSSSEKVTVLRRGRQLLNNAGRTFQNQYSCYTCHPDEHEDGLVYNMASKDMGRNVTNTQSLRDIGDTPPFKWNGKNQTVYKQDGMRFSTVLTRTEQFPYKDLDAITSYIMRGNPYPPNLIYNPDGNLTEAQMRGKEIFERTKDNFGREIPVNNRCVTCHPAPYYTNKQPFDVSTLAISDDSILFDTPHLNNIYASPPYLHDGRATTLEEIWTLYGKDDKHGLTGDMTKIDLNDLVEYLKSLRGPEYERKDAKIQKASFRK
jgi:YVTN family beta-propeller protein